MQSFLIFIYCVLQSYILSDYGVNKPCILNTLFSCPFSEHDHSTIRFIVIVIPSRTVSSQHSSILHFVQCRAFVRLTSCLACVHTCRCLWRNIGRAYARLRSVLTLAPQPPATVLYWSTPCSRAAGPIAMLLHHGFMNFSVVLLCFN